VNVKNGSEGFGSSIFTNLWWRWLLAIQQWKDVCDCTSMVHKNLVIPSLFKTLFPFIPFVGPNFHEPFSENSQQK
jgi:hypothetical protein